MQQKSFQTILYSTAGVIAMGIILVAFNVITGAFKVRVDLTKDKAYTLSPGTKAILHKLDTPVTIRFYWTRSSETATPETIYLNEYARQVKDLLGEYQEVAGNKLLIKELNPQPDSDAQDSARLDGVQGQTLRDGQKYYLGLCVSVLDQKQTIPFLDPNQQRLLEYDISRAISRVMTTDRPVVGIMSPLPVFGQRSNPMMARMGRQSSSKPKWEIIKELQSDYTVKQIPMDTDKIDPSVKVLLVIDPRGITDRAQYAIDQFVMRGGKLIAFLDPLPLVDSQHNRMVGNIPNRGSSLPKLLKAWGLKFNTTKVVADMNYRMQIGGPNGQPSDAPAFLDISDKGINRNDVVTSEIKSIWLPFAGAFTGTPVKGLKETVLLKSTKDAELANGFMAQMTGASMMKNFHSADRSYDLAIRLTGRFKTAFPNGEPQSSTNSTDASAKSDSGTSLKETKGQNTVILVGDADMLFDQFALRQMQTPFGNFSMQMNGNLDFAQNAVEQLTGNNNLIAIRSRSSQDYPFTRLKDMQAAAEEVYQSKIKELEDSLASTRQRLNQLQRAKQGNQRFILSPEQQKEIKQFQKKEAQVNIQLKDTRKKLRRAIDSLENRLKWINIAAMPFLVSLSGLGLALYKRKRTSAK